MKIRYFFILATISLCCSCKPSSVSTGLRHYADSTDNYVVHASYHLFSSDHKQTERSCQLLNTRINTFADSLVKAIQTSADTLFGSFNGEDRPAWPYELYLSDSVFIADSKYISVRFEAYTFTGGAHGMTDFYVFNYDVRNEQLLAPDRILNYAERGKIDTLLKKNFRNPDSCFTEIPTLEKSGGLINISPKAVCFTYPAYTLGAYYCGSAFVAIPLPELKYILLLKE